MAFAHRFIRCFVLLAAGLIALLMFWHARSVYAYGALGDIRLEEWYGFAAFVFLYLAMLISPLYFAVPQLLGKSLVFQSRRAVGVAAFGFAVLHSAVAFFGLLQGFAGIGFLDHRYRVSLFFGLIALVILLAMALTSFDWAVDHMGKYWKWLQRLVYLAALAAIIHVVTIGTHYSDLSSGAAEATFAALMLLLFLESLRFDAWLRKRYAPESRTFGYAFVIIFGALALFSYIYITQAGPGGLGSLSLNIHAQHEQQIRQLEAEQAASAAQSK